MNPLVVFLALPWLAIGAVLALLGAVGAARERMFVARARRTSGRVVAVGTRTWTTSSRSGHQTQHSESLPEVEYRVDGIAYTVTPERGLDFNPWLEGDALPVAYDPDMPGHARVVGYAFQYARPVARIRWGLFFAAIGALAWVAVASDCR